MKSVCLFYYKKLKIITKNPLFCRNSSNFVLHTVITFFVVSCNYRDGNANVRFHQQDTLERIFSNGVSALHFLLFKTISINSCTFIPYFSKDFNSIAVN